MNRLVLIGGVSMALATAAACATSEASTEPNAEPEPESSIPDASVQDVAVGSDARVEPRGPLCSPDGWCETILPDPDLLVRDISPLPDRAFAVANSPSSGIKVLEWASADSTWRYIDDNTQNEKVFADTAIRIWSPNADEVYYVASPGIIFYGRRPVAPATAWSWSSQRLEDNHPWNRGAFWEALTLGVWGTGSDDVYAWYSNTVFRRKIGTGGAVQWVPEYIANDFDAPDEHIIITGIAGKHTDDLWFAGVRRRDAVGSCDLVVRRASDGHHRIADGVLPETYGPCTARAGIPLFLRGGWDPPRQFQSLDGNRLLFLRGNNEIVQIAPDGDGYSVSSTSVPDSKVKNAVWTSLWGESGDRLWLAGSNNSSLEYGLVLQGTQVRADGGAYQYSSIALNGAPTPAPSQIRGTSNTNLWAVGDRYAIHKTTP